MAVGLSAALAAALMFGIAAILQATASRQVPLTAGVSAALVVGLLRQPLFLGALALNLTGFVFHLTALRTIPLFLAQSGIAASLAVTAILAVRVFHDPLGTRDWLAVAGVTIGLALMASAAGDVGDEHASTGFIVGLYVALALIAVGGVAAARLVGAAGTAFLGLLAGFGFAGVSIAARVLPDLEPATLASHPATYALILSGGMAFLLYSLALQRGSVTEATALMIVSQTLTPAAVGIGLLDDEIRSGWVVVAVVGFVLTGAGAIALTRFESIQDHSEAEATDR
jgi:drug/metabolite transporter (DMT)-like permease